MKLIKLLIVAMLALLGIGCGGVYTYYDTASGGDTVAVPAGWKQSFTPDTVTVEIYQPPYHPVNNPTPIATYSPGDPRIRGVTNAYVDPLSSMVVSRETGQDLTPSARTYASQVSQQYTGPDRDWFQSMVFVDLLDPMPQTGLAEVYAYTPTEDASSFVNITATTGGHAHAFEAQVLGPVTQDQFKAIGRVPFKTVTVTGNTVPEAIQVDLIHDPDKNNGGTGKAHVVNPTGWVKNTAWRSWYDSDINKNHLRVIMTPARDGIIYDMLDFKFYVAGGVTGLVLDSVQGFDVDGMEITDPINVTIN
jgi:hypothetical protein